MEESAGAPSTNQYVVGTAGHVDHGKSTLVQALTGIDPDRLAEEKARQLTIDLGFAWLKLPGGDRVGIVDVPGHERFIRNMLAGIGGIDAAILVIAADDGPMPQTREHLAILDLLQVDDGVVALTKSDLVDGEWLDIVSEEVRELLSSTSLAGAPLIPVSATTGRGLDVLVASLADVLTSSTTHARSLPPRLPVDRVFSMQGYGTVVTGTTSGSTFSTGQTVEIMPDRFPARIRGIRSHNTEVDSIEGGSRAALNLSGITVDQIARGSVVAEPGVLPAAYLLDGRFRLLESAKRPLAQNDEVDFFVASAELPARVTILDVDEVAPGDSAWIQFRFRSPVSTLNGDRFIVRQLSPSETLGGGVVIDADPVRHRRFRPDVIQKLETLSAGNPGQRVLQQIEDQPVEVRQLANHRVTGLDAAAVLTTVETLIAEGRARPVGKNRVISTRRWDEALSHLSRMLREYHEQFPLRSGMPRESLRLPTDLDNRAFDELVEEATDRGDVIDNGATIRLATFQVTLADDDREHANRFLQALQQEAFSPPSPDQFQLTEETVAALAAQGEIVQVASGIAFLPRVMDDIQSTVLRTIDDEGSITLARFRDLFGTSRKYAQAVLEYFDQQRITRRVGDQRKRGSEAKAVKS